MIKNSDLHPNYYFKRQDIFKDLFEVDRVWNMLKGLQTFEIKPKLLGRVENAQVGNIFLGEGSVVRPFSYIEDDVHIGRNCVIGPHAYIRGKTLIADNVEIGRAEIKNSILLSGSKAHHHSYIGDSIIGANVNIGAGFISANIKLDGSNVMIRGIDTGLRKLGAVIGDGTKIGCNTTTKPGALIGPDSFIYPNMFVREFVPANSILKLEQQKTIVKRY
jgi:bifunctional UDP-N-acetylglucosamine pyrophosphorylase/glucosamine-1-phosphate N-acetyltransferase